MITLLLTLPKMKSPGDVKKIGGGSERIMNKRGSPSQVDILLRCPTLFNLKERGGRVIFMTRNQKVFHAGSGGGRCTLY